MEEIAATSWHAAALPKLQSPPSGICGSLDADQLVALSKTTRRVRKEPGEELMANAMPIASYANVLRGVVKLTKVLEDGRQQVVGAAVRTGPPESSLRQRKPR